MENKKAKSKVIKMGKGPKINTDMWPSSTWGLEAEAVEIKQKKIIGGMANMLTCSRYKSKIWEEII